MAKGSRRSGSRTGGSPTDEKKSRLKGLVEWKKAATRYDGPLGHLIAHYFSTAHDVVLHGIANDKKIGHALRSLDRQREPAYNEDPKKNDALHYLAHGMVESLAVMVQSILEELRSGVPAETTTVVVTPQEEMPPQEWTTPGTSSEERSDFDLMTIAEEKLDWLLPIREEEIVIDGQLPSTSSASSVYVSPLERLLLAPSTDPAEVPLFSENPEMNGETLHVKRSDSPVYDDGGFEIVQAAAATAGAGSTLEAFFFPAGWPAQDAASYAESSVTPVDEPMEEEEEEIGPFECPHCDRVFERRCGLRIHIKVHSGIKCSLCNKNITSEERLQKHIERVHNGQGTKRRRVQKDWQIAADEDDEEDEVYEEARRNVNHLLQKAPVSKKKKQTNDGPADFFCQPCNRQFQCKSGFQQHMLSHERIMVQCTVCDQYITDQRMKMHMSKMHPKAYAEQLAEQARNAAIAADSATDSKVGIVRIFECATCWQQYRTRAQLVEHFEASPGHVERLNEAEF